MKAFQTSVCVILVCALFSSLFAPLHLKDLVIIEGVGIDMTDGGQSLSVQLLNTNSIDASTTSGSGNSTVTLEQKSSTVTDALTSLQRVLSKDMYYGHTKIAVISEAAIESGIANSLPYLLESLNSRADIAVCVSKCNAAEIMKSRENDARVPCENLVRLMKNNEKSGEGVYVSAYEVLDAYADKTSDMLLPVLDFSEVDGVSYCFGVALFDGNRISKILPSEDAAGLFIMLGRLDDVTLEFETEKLGNVTVTADRIVTESHADISDGSIVFDSNIKFKTVIVSAEKAPFGQLGEEEREYIKNEAERYVTELCKRDLAECKSASCDCLGVGRLLSLRSPDAYENLCDDWDSYFRSTKASITVTAE